MKKHRWLGTRSKMKHHQVEPPRLIPDLERPIGKVNHPEIHKLLSEAIGGTRFVATTYEDGSCVDIVISHIGVKKRFFSYSGGLTVPEGQSIERHLLERSLEALVLQFVGDIAQLKRSGYLRGTELTLKRGDPQ